MVGVWFVTWVVGGLCVKVVGWVCFSLVCFGIVLLYLVCGWVGRVCLVIL